MALQKYLVVLGSIVLTFYLLKIGQNLIIPLVLAVFIWYLINVFAQVIGKLPIGKWRLPKSICYLIALLAIIGVLMVLVSIISKNISDVIAAAPYYQKNLDRLIIEGYRMFNIQQPPDSAQLLRQLDFGAFISQSALAITSLIGRGGLVIFYLIFLFAEQRIMPKKALALFDEEDERVQFAEIVSKIDVDIRTYIGIKSFVSFLTSILSFIIMSLVGLDFAAFWAILIFVLNFIPNIGSIVATLLPSLLALIQFESQTPFFIVAGGVIFMQALVANIIEPRLMSTSLNMSPLVIILSLALWGFIWGIVGMFLCIPIMVIVMIIFSHFKQTRPIAVMLSRTVKI
ncbi:AI-2E family transporter [candidate division KSB1 bacterium]|nr:AI-2E family transporter [candidate division KSB1 bacterium]